MAKKFTQSELESIRKTVYATCTAKGIAPMIDSPFGKIINPVHSACVQKEYDDAIKAGNEGKLNLWFDKANSFIQAKGGFSGILQSLGNLSQAYQTGLAQGQSGKIGQQGDIDKFEADSINNDNRGTSGNIGIWIAIIALILILIIIAIWYFSKNSK